MEPFHIYDPDGRILRTGYALPTQPQVFFAGETQAAGWGDPATQYVTESGPTDRPTIPTPTAIYDLTQLPAGTVVTVTDESGTVYEITDLSDTLTLEGPQTYRVQVDPPFPYIAVDTTVEVA